MHIDKVSSPSFDNSLLRGALHVMPSGVYTAVSAVVRRIVPCSPVETNVPDSRTKFVSITISYRD